MKKVLLVSRLYYYYYETFLDTVTATFANRQSRSTPASASHSDVEPAGHILFNDNTLIPFNSIIAVSKWSSTATVGARDLKGLRISGFTSSRNGLAIILSAPPLSSPGDNKLIWRSGAPFLSVETLAHFRASFLCLSQQSERRER